MNHFYRRNWGFILCGFSWVLFCDQPREARGHQIESHFRSSQRQMLMEWVWRTLLNLGGSPEKRCFISHCSVASPGNNKWPFRGQQRTLDKQVEQEHNLKTCKWILSSVSSRVTFLCNPHPKWWARSSYKILLNVLHHHALYWLAIVGHTHHFGSL